MQKQHTREILTLKYYILWLLEHFIQGLLANISYRKEKGGREGKGEEESRKEKGRR